MLTLAAASAIALVAIWAGYPAVIRLVGGARRHHTRNSGDDHPFVSVIIASREDAAAIRERVADVFRGRYPADRLEVVLGLDAAAAAAAPDEFRDEGGRVVVVDGDAPGGKAAALNAAVRAARGDVLVFADTAQRFEPGAIAALVDALRDGRLGAVSGMLELPGADGALNLAERYWRYERWLRFWEARVHSSVGVTGAIYAMRRRLWRPLPAGLILDDLYVPMRLVLEGWRIGFTDRARATDVRRFAPGQEYHRKVRTLTGILQVCAWLPAVLDPSRNPVWAQFFCHKLLRLLTPYIAATGAIASASLVVRLIPPAALLPAFAFLCVLLLALTLAPGLRRAVVAQAVWIFTLQGSIAVATVNGLRGRWDVWR